MSEETAAFTLYRNCYGEYVQPYDAIQTETTEVRWGPDGIEVVTRPIDYDRELRARVLKEVYGVDVEIFDARITVDDKPLLDPVAEVETIPSASHYGIVSRRQACEQFGMDVEDVDAENAQDRAKWAEFATWAEIAALYQPNGGDA